MQASSTQLKPPQWRARITRWMSRETWVCLGLMLVGHTLGGVWWGFDLLNHFWPYYGLLLLIAAVWLLTQWQWRPGGWAVAALVWNLTAIVPYYLPRSSTDGEPLRLVVCNLLTGNATPTRAIEFLEATDADVLVLLEVDHEWMPRLKPLRAKYPHGRIIPQPGSFGIALLSRRPLVQLEQINFGLSGVPTLTAVIEDLDVRIIVTHPPPPIGGNYADRRDRQLADVAKFAADSARPVVVAGDLNATPWSATFRNLTARGRMRDSSLGFGLHPTWPTVGPVSILPIDHVLVSPTLGVRNRRVGPRLGSDHRPVVVDLVVPR
ncbi:MAG: endonuclease/exonuclease/phosphatase family protein [Planctomycetaceae bacterium]|nr:endonuclease/exonuclease/phosphatase family protein [Planctomycetaceae bacterium]